MKGVKSKLILVLVGGFVGFINGFFGGGGGMAVVPLLVLVCAYQSKAAHATAMCVILPICVFSAATYLLEGSFDLKIALPVCCGFLIGGTFGAIALKKIRVDWLRYVFSALTLFAGVKMLFF